jgi:hypothetical protein
MQWPFKTTVPYVQEHKTARIQYAVCADNVGAARRGYCGGSPNSMSTDMKLKTSWLLRAKKPRG